jgi:HEAT repeat protein
LASRLSRLLVAWQETAAARPGAALGEVPELVELAGRFRALAAGNRKGLAALMAAEEDDRRAVAAFTLGFLNDPASLATLYDAATDASGRVRAWAVYALAVRADPTTDARLLMALLGDEDRTVRARACQAVGACLGGQRKVRERARRLLFERLEDDSNQVRYQAAAAVERFAEPADAVRLRELAELEEVQLIRARILEAAKGVEASSVGG